MRLIEGHKYGPVRFWLYRTQDREWGVRFYWWDNKSVRRWEGIRSLDPTVLAFCDEVTRTADCELHDYLREAARPEQFTRWRGDIETGVPEPELWSSFLRAVEATAEALTAAPTSN